MWLRRVLFWWQFAAVVVLPTTVLIARGMLSSALGWDFLLYLLLCPILGLVMLVVAGLTAGRASVRRPRAVSWLDAAVMLVWHVTIVGFALADSAVLAVLVVVIAIAAFWIELVQLITETGRRMRDAVRDFDVEFAGVREEMRRESPSVQIGEVVVIHPADDDPEQERSTR